MAFLNNKKEKHEQNPTKQKEYQLSARELNIVRLISYGFSQKEIADKLFISPLTVSSHMKNIYSATGIHKVTELTRWYVMRFNKIKEKSMRLDFCLLVLACLSTSCSTTRIQQRNKRSAQHFKKSIENGTFINPREIQLIPGGYPDDGSFFWLTPKKQ